MNFTICEHKNLVMRKSFVKGEWVGYPKAKHFKFTQFDCETMEEVFEMLVVLQSKPTTTIVRGMFVGDVDTNSQYMARRLSIVKEDHPITIEDFECDWGCIDIDGFPLPDGIQEEEVPEYVLATKLAFLGDIDCVIQHSSKSGFDGFATARIHVWIQLDRGVMSSEMRRWAEQPEIDVDPSVFKCAQVHYIQNPMFEGCNDPIKNRYVLIKGSKRTYSPIIRPPVVYVAPVRVAYQQNGSEPWVRYLEQISRTNKHHYLTSAVCSYWQCRGEECDWEHFKQEALSYCQQSGHPDAKSEIVYPEIDDLVKFAKGFERASKPDTKRVNMMNRIMEMQNGI